MENSNLIIKFLYLQWHNKDKSFIILQTSFRQYINVADLDLTNIGFMLPVSVFRVSVADSSLNNILGMNIKAVTSLLLIIVRGEFKF